MKTLLLAALVSLLCSPVFAQDKDKKVSEFTAKISNKIQADCSKDVYDCGGKIQELMSQKKDFTEQVKICQELGQKVGDCTGQRMKEFINDIDKLNLNSNSPHFDRDFDQLVKKWDK
jgi:hypothetical protein